MPRTPEQKKLESRKNDTYDFAKQLAGLAGLPQTIGGLEELRRMINEGEGWLVWVWAEGLYTDEEIEEAAILREASESPEVE